MSRIPQVLLDYIADESERIHHGTIIIEVNADKPGRFDVVTERRERFHALPGTAGDVASASGGTELPTGAPGKPSR